jgi:hypothetical protein
MLIIPGLRRLRQEDIELLKKQDNKTLSQKIKKTKKKKSTTSSNSATKVMSQTCSRKTIACL